MRAAALGLVLAALAGCGAPPGGAATRAAAAGGLCPDPDPVRDGPLVDAIRRGDARAVEAALARDPGDRRAAAAALILAGRSGADPDQAACFAPYLD